MTLTKEQDFEQAKTDYRKSNDARWEYASRCSGIIGKYGEGASKELADYMNVSVDTVEDHAHAQWMFDKLSSLKDGAERVYVASARDMPYIYLAHFRALYDLQRSRKLTDEQVMNLLMDIVQAEGGISSRNLENHVNSKYGDTRTFDYYAGRVRRELKKLIGHPGGPRKKKTKAKKLFYLLGGKDE